MPVDDAVHRGDVPPPIDLGGHMRELMRALLPALVVAVLIGAAVFYVRSELTDEQYAASIVTEIEPSQTLVPGDAFIEQMRAPFIELATDTVVLDEVLSRVDTDLDVAQLGSSVELIPGASPALLTFTVTASSPELALELAQAMVSAVAQASDANAVLASADAVERAETNIATAQSNLDALPPDDPGRPAASAVLLQAQNQLTEVQSAAGGDRLVVLSSPEQSDTPVAPKPLSEALVAALAALIVAAEVIVLLRGRFGRRPGRSWARRAARKHGAHFAIESAGAMPPVLDAKIGAVQREGSSTTGSARHAVRARDSIVVVLVGDAAHYDPPAPTRSEDDAARRSPVVRTALTDEWWRGVDIADVEAVAVVVSARGKDRTAATDALARIAPFDVPTYLVLQPKNHRRTDAPPTPTQISEVQRDAR